MKNNLLLIFSFFVLSFSYAQEYSIGIKGGVNYYTIGDINSRGGSIQTGKANETFTPNKEMGTQLGAFVNIDFGKVYIRPELNVVTNKSSYDFPKKTSNWKASKIDFPILFGFKIYDPVSIYAGPTFSFFNKMTIEGANNITEASPILYEKSTTSVSLGAQVEFKRFGIDLRYEFGLKETVGEHGSNYQDFVNSAYGINIADIWSYKPSQISLSLNIFLFRTDGDEIGSLFKRNNNCGCPY